MRARELIREYDEQDYEAWESWPGKAREIDNDYVKLALSDPNHHDHKIFKIVRDNVKSRLYRGIKAPTNWSKIYYLDPTTAPDRTSAGTHNFYTMFMDHISKDWQAYPKRSRSFICATNPSSTGFYGSTYVIVPTRQTRIGICPTDDMWYSFRNIDLNTVVNVIAAMFKGYNIPYPKTPEELVKASELVAEQMISDQDRYLKVKINSAHMTSMMGQAYYNPITFMEQHLNPKENGFKLADWPTNLDGGHEVWFSEPCYAIPMKIFPSLMGLSK